MLFGDAHVKVARGKMRSKEIESGAAGHGGRNGDDALVFASQRNQRIGKDFGVGRLAVRLVCRLRVVWPQAVKLFLPIECWLIAAPFLRQHMKQHRALGGFEKLEALDQKRAACPSIGPEYLQAKPSKSIEGTSKPLAASSARRTTSTAILPPSRSTMRRAESCRFE